MRSPNGSNHTTQTPPPLSFYNTFKAKNTYVRKVRISKVAYNQLTKLQPMLSAQELELLSTQ